jgi:hypothetical protein
MSEYCPNCDVALVHIRDLEESLAKYQACRVHDVDEKAWLSKRVTELEAENAALRHDLARSMANHVADSNASETEAGK